MSQNFLQITITNGELSNIDLNITGSMNTSYQNLRDFSAKCDAAFSLKYELKVTSNASKFEPAATVDKVK